MNRFMFYFVLLLPLVAISQIISFEPEIDTLKIGGGCTPPQIIASLRSDNPSEDSLFVIAGWNTSIWSDNHGDKIYYQSVFFTIKTLNSDFDYKLYISSSEQNSFGDTLVPFDTTFEFEAQEFFLRLIVLDQGVPIDSLSKFFISQIGVGIKDLSSEQRIPNSMYLLSCYPNPFNQDLTIDFKIPRREFVHISIFNNIGQELTELYAGLTPEGIRRVHWNADQYSSGNYYILLRSGDQKLFKKVILIK